jgi:hypothetical protein
MDSGYAGIIVALVVAVVVSVIDLSVHRSKGLYLRALPLCILFVVFDATAALIFFIVLRAGAERLKDNPTTAAAVVAGLVAPLLMRTKISVPFTKGQQVVNAVAMLRRLQILVSEEISDVCAAGETAWILDKVLPALRAFPLLDVEAWVIQSINVKYAGPEARTLRRKSIDDVRNAADDSLSEEERKHLLVQILIDRCSRHQVKALVRRAKSLTNSASNYPSTAVHSQTPNELEAATIDDREPVVDPDIGDPNSASAGQDDEGSSD